MIRPIFQIALTGAIYFLWLFSGWLIVRSGFAESTSQILVIISTIAHSVVMFLVLKIMSDLENLQKKNNRQKVHSE